MFICEACTLSIKTQAAPLMEVFFGLTEPVPGDRKQGQVRGGRYEQI
jgi:hypothetical protein